MRETKSNFLPNNVRTVSLKEIESELFYCEGTEEDKALQFITISFLLSLSIAAHWIICGTSKALIILISPTFASKKAP